MDTLLVLAGSIEWIQLVEVGKWFCLGWDRIEGRLTGSPRVYSRGEKTVIIQACNTNSVKLFPRRRYFEHSEKFFAFGNVRKTERSLIHRSMMTSGGLGRYGKSHPAGSR